MALRLRGATSGYIELKAPASAGDNTLTLPTNNGSANQLLKTDGSGNLSWTDDNSGVSLSGSTNNTIATVTGANALAGEANLTFDGSLLTVTGNSLFAGQIQFSGLTTALTNISQPIITRSGSSSGAYPFDGFGHLILQTRGDGTNRDIIFATGSSGAIKTVIKADGKIGINITSPDSLLHVHNGSAGSIAASSAANLTIESSASDYNVLQFLSPSTAAQQIRFGDPSDNGAGWIQYNHSSNALQFGTAGPEKMKLDSDGRLLIGTTQTASKLTVDTDFCVIRASSDPTINLLLGTTGSITKLYRILIDDSDSDKFQIRDDDTARITINGSGNVGINTTSPNYKLEVAEGTTDVVASFTSSDANAWIQIRDDDTTDTAVMIGANDDSMMLRAGSNTRMIIAHDGKVGIGTDSPGQKVHIYEAAADSQCYLKIQNNRARNAAVMFTTTNGSWYAGQGIGADVDRFMIYDSTPRFEIFSTGCVGINGVNCNQFSEKLQVKTNEAAGYGIAIRHTHDSAGSLMRFSTFDGSNEQLCGSINGSGTSTSFNTSSDYRLKENIVDFTDGITKLKTLKPKRFNWISDPTNTTIDGFLAHEITAVPEAVWGTKDATEATYWTEDEKDNLPEGKAVGDVKNPAVIVPQQLDQSKLVPLITAALKEAIAKIETLETKVAALESA